MRCGGGGGGGGGGLPQIFCCNVGALEANLLPFYLLLYDNLKILFHVSFYLLYVVHYIIYSLNMVGKFVVINHLPVFFIQDSVV